MAFELIATECVPESVRRLTAEQLDDAERQLSGGGETDRDDAVHETRKALKRVRATLRFVRDGLDDGLYDKENAALRDAGDMLAGLRDARVLLVSLDGLVADDLVAAESLEPLTHVLWDEYDEHWAAAHRAGTLDEARQRIADASDRLAALDVADDDAVLVAGARRTLQRGRKRQKAADSAGSDATFHDWRKRVKDHWHQLQLLAPVWPETLEVAADAAHALSDDLGDDHDLAVLADLLEQRRGLLTPPATEEMVWDVVRTRREVLQAAALARGRRIYAEKPKAFARRHASYLAAWRSEASSAG